MNKPLTVNGTSYSVQSAELSLRIETETWDGATEGWVYGRQPVMLLALELWLDNGSGEDGALAPNLYFHLPSQIPADLNGLVLEEKEHQVEAWWGNDAPALGNNRLELKTGVKQNRAKLLWTATTSSGQDLVFEGEVDFMGLSLKVKKSTDVEGFLRQVWPAVDINSLELASESEIDFGDDWPEDRRHWLELHYDI